MHHHHRDDRAQHSSYDHHEGRGLRIARQMTVELIELVAISRLRSISCAEKQDHSHNNRTDRTQR